MCYRPKRLLTQPLPPSVRRSNTVRSNQTTPSDILSTVSFGEVLSDDPQGRNDAMLVDAICPERIPGIPVTSSKSLPCYDDLEVVGSAQHSKPTGPARSGTAPLPGALRNLNPPQRSFGTAGYAHGAQEPYRALCPIRLEWEALGSAFDPASRDGQT